MFVPEAFVKRRVAMVELGERSSVVEATPPPLKVKTDVELAWRLMKSPLKLAARLAPINVPEAEPAVNLDGPRDIRAAVLVSCGVPVSETAFWPVAVPRRLPVKVIFVEDT